MSQALLISDNEVLNDLYSVNLEVYVGTNVTIKRDIDEALKLLELSPNIDIVICLDQIAGKDLGVLALDFMKENKLQIPLVVIGNKTEVSPEEAGIISAGFNIRSMVRTIAKIMGVTAKEMAEKAVPDFYPVPTKLFFNLDTLPCDVFFRNKINVEESEYTKICFKGDSLESGIRNYLDQGIQNLYVDKMFRLEFIDAASSVILGKLEDANTSSEEKMEMAEQGAEIIAEQLAIDQKVTEEMVKLSKACIDVVNQAVAENNKFKGLLRNLVANKTRYAYMHSMLATYVANHIIDSISWGGESHAEKVSFVLFFHDIFLIPIYNKYPELKYEEDLLFSEKLSDKEKEVVLSHAKLAGQVVQDIPRCPMGADAIVTQHHGVPSGEGFAVKFKDDISPLAKVVIVAEAFCEEMLKRLDENPNRAVDKVEIIRELSERFKRNSYQKIVDTLENIEI